MGQNFCCCPKESEELISMSENSYLLSNCETNGWKYNSWPTITTQSQLSRRSDDQKHLNDSLIEIVNKMIDIPAIDRPDIDKRERILRERMYTTRVAQIDKPLPLRSKPMVKKDDLIRGPLLKNIPLESISDEDLHLINRFSTKASEAVVNGFQIHCKDSVIVEFKP